MDTAAALGSAVSQITRSKSQAPTTRLGRVTQVWELGFGICVLTGLLGIASPVSAAERYAIVVSGASGDEKYAAQQKKWRNELEAFLTTNFAFPEANLVFLDEASEGSLKATADNVRRVLGDLRRRTTRDDVVLVLLMGHGTFDGIDAKFNLVGPDLTAPEWKQLVDGLAARLVLVNTTAASFPFVEQLSRQGRVIITATDSAQQRFSTVFPEYFIRALADRSSDLDKNGRVSILEAFTSASAGVRQHYERLGQLSTERAVLDDDGDGAGREAEAPGQDGALARALYFDPERPSDGSDPVVAALERQRASLEQQLEDLKSRRNELPEDKYQAELERIFIELARIGQQIRKRSGT